MILEGKTVRLEPLALEHVEGLVAAIAGEDTLYEWSLVPRDTEAMLRYVATAIRLREQGTALPFAIVRQSDGVVLGSTRFFDMPHWDWPKGHERAVRTTPDVCEIGYSWLTRSAIRTAANTEAKLLLMTYGFETWDVLSVCLTTDVRNLRSRAAIERIGGKLDGVLRAHRLAADATPRNSARYSIVAQEWPAVKRRLQERLDCSVSA